MPDLASRLAALHSVLTDRLALHGKLLALSGKLDLVITQTEIRSSSSQKPAESKKDPNSGAETVTTHYIEGDSSDDENLAKSGDIPEGMASVDEDESIEDVELGAGSDGDPFDGHHFSTAAPGMPSIDLESDDTGSDFSGEHSDEDNSNSEESSDSESESEPLVNGIHDSDNAETSDADEDGSASE